MMVIQVNNRKVAKLYNEITSLHKALGLPQIRHVRLKNDRVVYREKEYLVCESCKITVRVSSEKLHSIEFSHVIEESLYRVVVADVLSDVLRELKTLFQERIGDSNEANASS